MKFRMIVKEKDTDRPAWNEDYDRTEIKTMDDARWWAKETIANFNATLRPHEKPRELVSVEYLDDESSKHEWTKTNLTTISDPRGGMYDEIECVNCTITGRRYGLTSIQRDPEFKAMGYGDCKQAKVLLERRRISRAKRIAKAKKIDKD